MESKNGCNDPMDHYDNNEDGCNDIVVANTVFPRLSDVLVNTDNGPIASNFLLSTQNPDSFCHTGPLSLINNTLLVWTKT